MKRLISPMILAMMIVLLVAACSSAPDVDDTVEHSPGDAEQPAQQVELTPVDNASFSPVTISNTDVLVMESYPIQIAVTVSGTMPTPCHHLRYDVAAPDEEDQIHITVDSWVEPEQVCAQVLEAFEQRIPVPLNGVEDGDYTVWVNGEQVGGFSYPGG